LDVSTVIPLYNKAAYVARALRSALDQTSPPREIIVVDDGSTDDGPGIVARIAADDPRVRLIRQPNAGPSAARNRGIDEASGDWVAFLDADDVLLPRHFERAAHAARRYPEAQLVAAAYREVTECSHEAVAATLANEPDSPPQIVTRFFERWCHSAFFFTSSVLVRKAALVRLAPAFPKGEKLGEDQDLWFRLVESGPIVWSGNVGALYTIGLAASLTGASIVTDPLPSYERLKARIAHSDFPPSLRSDASRLAATHWLNVARARAETGDTRGARALLRDPIARHRPLYWLRSAAVVWSSVLLGRPAKLGPI